MCFLADAEWTLLWTDNAHGSPNGLEQVEHL